MGKWWRQFWREEEGQGLVEYAVLLAAVVLLVIAVASIIGNEAVVLIEEIGEYISERGATTGQ